jgi:methyl acetate hydrolase
VYQLIDQGLAELDDPEIVARILPEIALDKLEILDGYDGDIPRLRKATVPITLGMLLSHSAGG